MAAGGLPRRFSAPGAIANGQAGQRGSPLTSKPRAGGLQGRSSLSRTRNTRRTTAPAEVVQNASSSPHAFRMASPSPLPATDRDSLFNTAPPSFQSPERVDKRFAHLGREQQSASSVFDTAPAVLFGTASSDAAADGPTRLQRTSSRFASAPVASENTIVPLMPKQGGRLPRRPGSAEPAPAAAKGAAASPMPPSLETNTSFSSASRGPRKGIHTSSSAGGAVRGATRRSKSMDSTYARTSRDDAAHSNDGKGRADATNHFLTVPAYSTYTYAKEPYAPPPPNRVPLEGDKSAKYSFSLIKRATQRFSVVVRDVGRSASRRTPARRRARSCGAIPSAASSALGVAAEGDARRASSRDYRQTIELEAEFEAEFQASQGKALQASASRERLPRRMMIGMLHGVRSASKPIQATVIGDQAPRRQDDWAADTCQRVHASRARSKEAHAAPARHSHPGLGRGQRSASHEASTGRSTEFASAADAEPGRATPSDSSKGRTVDDGHARAFSVGSSADEEPRTEAAAGGNRTTEDTCDGARTPRRAAEAAEMLGLGPNYSASDVRAAYVRAAMRWHPDRPAWVKAGEESVGKATAAFRRARAAHDLLLAETKKTGCGNDTHS